MILERLRLYNFRVYQEQLFHPAPGLNLLSGPNGAGKTAVLEALHLLSAARSFRARREQEVCRWGAADSRIEGLFRTQDGHPRELGLSWRRTEGEWKKAAQFQGDQVARLSDFLGCVPLSLFTPDDLALVHGAPSVRRRYLDLTLSKMSPLHLLELARLRKVLSARNSLLRQNRPARELKPWDRLLFDLSLTVGRRRERVALDLAHTCADFFGQLTGRQETLQLAYKRCWPTEWNEFETKLEELQLRERQRGSTLLSPQKDDLEIAYQARSLRLYGSQGEQRMVALCLRLAEAKLLGEQKEEGAILLLDDAFSELDPERKERLIALLPNFSQVFLTSASPLPLEHTPHTAHQVEQGQLAPPQKV